MAYYEPCEEPGLVFDAINSLEANRLAAVLHVLACR